MGTRASVKFQITPTWRDYVQIFVLLFESVTVAKVTAQVNGHYPAAPMVEISIFHSSKVNFYVD